MELPDKKTHVEVATTHQKRKGQTNTQSRENQAQNS
jgi:hypothetical protein